MKTEFKTMVVSEAEDGKFYRSIVTKDISALPPGEVLMNVKYSSLNYKDALSANGNKGVTKEYPHTPGIDAAGIVEESSSDSFKPGDKVLVTGYDLGMNTSGGFSQYVRIPEEWVVKVPEGLTLKESMIFGTAGFTAAISVRKLVQHGIKPQDGDILVTGATGGVGSIAVSILNKLGYRVIAATGKVEQKEYMTQLGAKDIIPREELNDQSGRPLLKVRWAGVIDTVGGNVLATALKSVRYGGCVTCCGNVASYELPTTVYPFILRGVSLFGVDSVQYPMDLRSELWAKLATEWKPENLDMNAQEISLTEVSEKIDLILKGQIKGRTVINLDL